MVFRARKLVEKISYTTKKKSYKKKIMKNEKSPGHSTQYKTNNYYFNYDISMQKMHVNFLKNTSKKINISELTKIYKTILMTAKEKNVKKIVASTWIFYQHPELAEKLGFKIVKGTDYQIKKILKKYPDYKIKGLNMDFKPRKYQLTIVNNKTKLEKEITISKIHLPMFVKKI